MLKILLLSLAPFVFFQLSAQHYTIEGKNLSARINPGGQLFFNPSNSRTEFEIPKSSGLSTIYAGQIWIGGIDSATGLVITSAESYRQHTTAFHGGPVSQSYTGEYDSVFGIEGTDISNHIQNFLNPNYQMPLSIANWPAKGDLNNGEPENMAEFADYNQNGEYEPLLGDHPLTRGNSGAFTVFNDIRDTIGFQGSPCCLGVDVYSYIYDLSYQDADLENTLFFNYRIKNRSSRTYQDVYVGMWMDADIGDASDDFAGCEPSKNLYYAYNGDNDDDLNYGQNPPAQGFIFLSHPISNFMTYYNNFDSVNGNPESDTDFYNYLTGKWKNGFNLTEGGIGIDQNNPIVDFMYPGNGWDEFSAGNVPGERRLIGSIGPFNLIPGEEIEFDYALLYFRDSTVNNIANRDSLIAHSDLVQSYYDIRIASLKSLDKELLDIQIFPNPSSGVFNLDLRKLRSNVSNVKVFNSMGHLILEKNQIERKQLIELNLELQSNGIYFVRIESEKGNQTQRIIKE